MYERRPNGKLVSWRTGRTEIRLECREATQDADNADNKKRGPRAEGLGNKRNAMPHNRISHIACMQCTFVGITVPRIDPDGRWGGVVVCVCEYAISHQNAFGAARSETGQANNLKSEKWQERRYDIDTPAS